MDINIKLRAEILEYSLFIEKLINDLLLLNLGIYDEKEKTRLFSNKGKLTFQNKIDLLYDIEILSKDENSEFELLMNIRNKFLHDLDCNSFQVLLSQLDKGIVNRFKKYLDNEKLISNEDACEKACNKLFKKNMETIKQKIKAFTDIKENTHKFYKLHNEQIIFYIDAIHDLLEKVSIATEKSELENPKVAILGEKILRILEEAVKNLNAESKKVDFEDFFNSNENMKSLFGIKSDLNDLPKWTDFRLSNSNNPDK
jgi:5'-deoxynucleotidase YfbR-like HD superfamily hydrolase